MAPINTVRPNPFLMTQAERDEYFRRKLLRSGYFTTTFYTSSPDHPTTVLNLPFGFGVHLKARQWPWQMEPATIWNDLQPTRKHGWWSRAAMGRFGGGWQLSLGVRVSGSSIHADLLLGMVGASFYNLNGLRG